MELGQLIQERGHPGIIPSPGLIESYRSIGLTPPKVEDWAAPPPERAVTGTRSMLVIRIDFPDRAGTQSQAYYQNLLFGTSQGQLRHYYGEVSYGLLTVTGTVTANWLRSGLNMTWWGADEGDIDGKNDLICELAREAVTLADSVFDFAPYDTNSDGVITPDELSLCIVHAGSGQESTGVSTDIWSHRWYMFGQGYSKRIGWTVTELSDTFVDGKRISKHPADEVGGYFMQAETSPIGTFAHEFGHDLGLPDLYDTDYSSDGVGDWCLMSSGSWLGTPSGSRPAHLNGWCKARLGWVDASLLSSGTYTVKQMETNPSQSLYKLAISSTEYFLVENRQKAGYDFNLPGSGILIWHIDDSKSSNSLDSDRWVDLEEAHGRRQHLDNYTDGNSGDANDPFYSPQNTSFTESTDPSSKTKAGTLSGFGLTSIGSSGTVMSMVVNSSDFSRVSSITYTDKPLSGVIDPLGQYAYFGLEHVGAGGAVSPIAKIRLSDFYPENTLLTADGYCVAAMMDPSGQYAYFAYASGNVSKIRLSDFRRIGAISLSSPPIPTTIHSAVIDPSGQYAYLGIYSPTSPAVVKIRLSDMTRIGAVTLNADEFDPKAAIIDPSGKYAYFGTYTEKGKIVRIRLSDFTRYDAITLPSGWGYLQSAATDPSGKYSYWTCGNVFKVNLETFTLVGSLNPLTPPYLPYHPVVIDPLGQYAYIGIYDHPGTVVKIDLLSFTRVGEVTLRTDEDNLVCAVIDPKGQYAYFGCLWPPGAVVRIRLSSPGFDFSLSCSGGVNLVRGSSSPKTVTVTLTGGTTQTVALSASGLPSGVSASFKPASDIPTFTSTCNLTASSSTPSGNYTVTVIGSGGGKIHNATFGLTVSSSPAFGQTISTLFADVSYTLGFMVTGNIYDDSGIGFMYAHRSPPKILFSKADAGRVLPTGQPTWSGYTQLVTVGGRNANPTTRYYEDNGLARLKWAGTSTSAIIMSGSEVKLNVPLSSLGSANDYFVMQIIIDGTHRAVILWGITQYGTYASGVYFDGIFPILNTLSQGWYIIRWQDQNGDGIVDYSTEFTIVASGI